MRAAPFHTDHLSVRQQQWALAHPCEEHVQKLRQTLGLTYVGASVLAARASDLEHAQTFLNPCLASHLRDPACLPGMALFLERMHTAIVNAHQVTLWGDYDVDGATSVAILARFLTQHGLQPGIYIPDRMREGYGPNITGLAKLKKQGCELVIFLDSGTSACQPIAYAREIGLDVIVIDHHDVPDAVPDCCALVNPKLDSGGTSDAFKHMAAAGVTFMCVVAMRRFLREKGFYVQHPESESDIRPLLGLVALGTVCDVMPLSGMNRLFVRKGLEYLNQQACLGLQKLAEVAGLNGPLTAGSLGFSLGPRINAGGRMGHALLGARLLLCGNNVEALELAQKLNQLNAERQDTEKLVLEAAYAQAQSQQDASCVIVHGQGWHEGVIGIVASRLKERFQKPAFVICFDSAGNGKGSARSVPGVGLGDMIARLAAENIVLQGGGHAMAAGFSLTKDQLIPFRQALLQAVTFALKEAPPLRLSLDVALTFSALTRTSVQELAQLEPFGAGNPKPVCVFYDVRILSLTVLKEQHFRLRLAQVDGSEITCMAFRAVGSLLESVLRNPPPFVHIAASLSIDQFRSVPQLILEDVCVSPGALSQTVVGA